MKLSILIISYNTQDLTLQTLDSVAADIEHGNLSNQVEVLVIDNNSSDGSVAALKKWTQRHKFAQLIENKTNLGFAKANNQGLKKSRGELILFLNSDTIVRDVALTQLIKTFDSHPIQEHTEMLSSINKPADRLGVVAALLLNPDGTIQPQGGHLPNLFTVAAQMLFLDDLPVIGRLIGSTQHTGLAKRNVEHQRLVSIGWVGGTAMVVRREMVNEIGPFDQNIFMYAEDMELCLRAAHRHWDVAIQPKAQVTHFGSASSSSQRAIQGEFEGLIYIWSKHFPHWQRPVLLGILRLGASCRWLLFTLLRNSKRASIYSTILREVLS